MLAFQVNPFMISTSDSFICKAPNINVTTTKKACEQPNIPKLPT